MKETIHMLLKHDTFKRALHIISRLALIAGLVVIVLPLLAAPSDLDPTWGNSGEALIDFDGDGVGDGYAIYTGITQNGKHISVGAYYGAGEGKFAVMRLLKNGQRDLQFGNNGAMVVPLLPGYEYAQVAYGAIQSNGKILIIGMVFPTADVERSELALVRINTDGTIDLSFGEQGYKILRPGYLEDGLDGGSGAIDVAVAPDDKVLVASADIPSDGNQAGGIFVTRLNPDGSLDSSFDDNGVVSTGLSYARDIILQPDAKLLIAGRSHTVPAACSITAAATLLRLNADGSPDLSFGDNGLVNFFPRLIEYGTQEEDSWLNSIQILPDGRIFVSGSGNPDCPYTLNPVGYLARLTDNGTLDESFGENGIIFPSLPDNVLWDFWRSDLQPDGKSVVSYLSFDVENDFDVSNGIARFNMDGSFDSSWNKSGYIDTGDSQGMILFPHTTIDKKGRIVVTQSRTLISSTLRRFKGNPAFGYTSLSPQHRQKKVSTKANLKLTFPKSVTVNTGKIEIRHVSDFGLFETISVTDGTRVTGGGTNTITINPLVDFEPNTKYYVLVDPNTFTNASGHPFSGVRELTEWHFTTGLTNFVLNSGFEGKGGKATRPAKWTVNKLTNTDRRICNVERDGKPDLIYAHSGQCAFRFQSGVVKARNIQQEIVLTDAFADQTLDLSAFVRTNNLTSGAKVQVMLTYADDSKKTVNLNVSRGTKPYRKVQKSLVLPNDVASARVRIITGTSKGTLLIDDLSLTINEATALPMTIQVPAASDLRGN